MLFFETNSIYFKYQIELGVILWGIGEGIRKMRKQHKLTMDQLANNLNTTFPKQSNFTKK